MIIVIKGTTEPLITTGRSRRCPLCGNEFTIGSLHGRLDFEIDEAIAADEHALDAFGDLACPACLTAAAYGELTSRMQEYAAFLRHTAHILDLLTDDAIEPQFDPSEIQYTGTIEGGPLMP